MPDGLVVERLPAGLANGMWRLAFVITGPFQPTDRPPEGVSWFQTFYDRVQIDGIGAELNSPSGGSSGGSGEYEYNFIYEDNGLTALRITYLHDGAGVTSEVLDLT
jgi:hypothetical protein